VYIDQGHNRPDNHAAWPWSTEITVHPHPRAEAEVHSYAQRFRDQATAWLREQGRHHNELCVWVERNHDGSTDVGACARPIGCAHPEDPDDG
jgi:hypothetical protein